MSDPRTSPFAIFPLAPYLPPVTPAKAGVQGRKTRRLPWIPAFAGMTMERENPWQHGLSLPHPRLPCRRQLLEARVDGGAAGQAGLRAADQAGERAGDAGAAERGG